MESAETPDEGGHPPDDEVGLHHSPPDDVFKVISSAKGFVSYNITLSFNLHTR